MSQRGLTARSEGRSNPGDENGRSSAGDRIRAIVRAPTQTLTRLRGLKKLRAISITRYI
ncbi:hypothetical protein [Microcoleus sp. herbarium12]|uniref:hypothetical protein n=1 Tax=Microcoleus sp. herbarium12 TaxID=3055437 RepID=UPI002FD6E166